MSTPLTPDKALYLPIEIISGADFGPLEITLGVQAEDDAGNLQYDDNGNPEQDPYDLGGYTVTAPINATTAATSASENFVVGTSALTSGSFTLSLTDAQTTTIAGWKATTKPTEKVAEYRVYLEIGGTKKVKVYGPISINIAGA